MTRAGPRAASASGVGRVEGAEPVVEQGVDQRPPVRDVAVERVRRDAELAVATARIESPSSPRSASTSRAAAITASCVRPARCPGVRGTWTNCTSSSYSWTLYSSTTEEAHDQPDVETGIAAGVPFVAARPGRRPRGRSGRPRLAPDGRAAHRGGVRGRPAARRPRRLAHLLRAPAARLAVCPRAASTRSCAAGLRRRRAPLHGPVNAAGRRRARRPRSPAVRAGSGSATGRSACSAARPGAAVARSGRARRDVPVARRGAGQPADPLRPAVDALARLFGFTYPWTPESDAVAARHGLRRPRRRARRPAR